jgi:hypothetical protein
LTCVNALIGRNQGRSPLVSQIRALALRVATLGTAQNTVAGAAKTTSAQKFGAPNLIRFLYDGA